MTFKITWVLESCPIYRIMPLFRLEEMIESRQNVLIRPSLWKDPYENISSNSVVVRKGGQPIPLNQSYWFGQCWSICDECALMWQSFAPELQMKSKDTDDFRQGYQHYVKIKVRVDNLIKQLNDEKTDNSIGVVDYIRYFHPDINNYKEKVMDVKSFHEWIPNMIRRGTTYEELLPLYSLLTKRDVFRHEEEVRLLVFDKSAKPEQEMFSYPFDINSIEEVIIDPWTPEKEVNEIKERLKTSLNDNVVIKKSELYKDSKKFAMQYSIG